MHGRFNVQQTDNQNISDNFFSLLPASHVPQSGHAIGLPKEVLQLNTYDLDNPSFMMFCMSAHVYDMYTH